jgi:hypothetical protein
MFVTTLAVYKQFNIDIVLFWLAFAFFDKLKSIKAPTWESYFYFRSCQSPNIIGIVQLLKSATQSKMKSPAASGGPFRLIQGTKQKFPHTYDSTNIDIEGFAQHLVRQFPCQTPVGDPYTTVAEVPTSTVMAVIEPEFSRQFQNYQLSEFIVKVEVVLQDYRGDTAPWRPMLAFQQHKNTIAWGTSQLAIVTNHSLFQTASAALRRKSNADKRAHAAILALAQSNLTERPKKFVAKTAVQALSVHSESSESKELRGIFKDLAKSESKTRQEYIGDLVESLDAFCIVKQREDNHSNSTISTLEAMPSHGAVDSCIRDSLDRLRHTLVANHGRVLDWLTHGVLAPCMSPTSLLEQLRSHTGAAQAYALKKMLADYGIAIAQLQQLLRITDAKLKDNIRKVHEETKNCGHGNWSPVEHPDWLLIELEGNFLIRDEQVIVALATISPDTCQNSLLQMNMGQVRFRCPMTMLC